MATSMSYTTGHSLQPPSAATAAQSSVNQMYLRGPGGRFTSSPPLPPQSLPSPSSEVPKDDANIVIEWLTFLQLEHYSKEFLDNGYDDLETLKRVGPEDLDAIGVVSVHHRSFLLDAVRVLREQGAAWVYLLLGARERAIADLQQQQQQQHHHLLMTQQQHQQQHHVLLIQQQQQQQHQQQLQSDYDRVSASSGIASANSSSMPWPEDQELSGSSCECDQCPPASIGSRSASHHGSRSRNASGRKQKNKIRQNAIHPQQQVRRTSPILTANSPSPLGDSNQSHCDVPTPSVITSASSTTIGGRSSVTQSVLEHASCLTEMTDCPSEFSSISNQLHRRISGSRISSRTIGSTGRSSVDTRRFQTNQFSDQGPDVIQLAPASSLPAEPCDPHVLRLQRQLHKLRLQHYPSQCDQNGLMGSVRLRAVVSDKLTAEGIRLSSPPYTSSTAGGNDSYLLNLASRYSEDLGISSYLDVLQQLEDLRLAEWSEVTPPAPPPSSSSTSKNSSEAGTAYVNFNPASNGTKSRYLKGDPLYAPGTYTPSSCLSDRDGDQIYDYATKYRTQMRQNQAKMFMSPQGWIQMARKIMSKGSSSSSNATSSKHHNKQQQRFQPRGSSISESNLSGLCNNNGTHRGRKNRTETGISLNPDTGRHSPDGVTVYKNKVLYHSRADFRSAGLTAQNSAPTFYGDKEGAI